MAKEFISRFPTISSRPFDELSAKLIEYSSLSRSIERMKRSLDEFAEEHGIDPESIRDTDEPIQNELPDGELIL